MHDVDKSAMMWQGNVRISRSRAVISLCVVAVCVTVTSQLSLHMSVKCHRCIHQPSSLIILSNGFPTDAAFLAYIPHVYVCIVRSSVNMSSSVIIALMMSVRSVHGLVTHRLGPAGLGNRLSQKGPAAGPLR